jgi:mRNA-degrading endonuclease toxin of MazEF toxin-antitoxin module
VLVVASESRCIQPRYPNVIVVLLSAQPEMAGEDDVLILKGEGGVDQDSIAQPDIVFTLAKQDLPLTRWKGRVQQDTLIQVRAALARVVGLA